MSGCPNCGYFHPPDGVCLETIEPLKITSAFGVPLDELDKIKAVVMEAWENYGDDDGPTCERIRRDGIWNDHVAVQAGIAVWKMMKGKE